MHRCPSGLRGATQVRMALASWVRIPFCASNALIAQLVRALVL